MFWLIVGLGNPGLKYRPTRHNIGFLALDHLSKVWLIPLSKKSHNSLWGQGRIGNDQVIISKPQTFMNRSGISVKSFIKSYNINFDHLIVIHDDMDLMPGRLRIRDHGGAGGHKGVKSIIDLLDTDLFIRLRIGIGKACHDIDPADYVLSNLLKDDKEDIMPIISSVDKIIETIMEEGLSTAMNLYNR